MSGDERLVRVERPAVDPSAPAGLLVLLHGRGADAHDLQPLLDLLDPARRLHGVTLQAPLQLPGEPGWHWYIVQRVGFPHPETFLPSLRALEHEIDMLLDEHGLTHDQLVLGGFSQGAVMSIAAAFGSDRPRPAALLAWSGFVPSVEGWELDASVAAGVPVLLTHGRVDPVITIGFGEAARDRLEGAGAKVEWRDPPIAHELDPATILRTRQLLDELLAT